MLDAVRTIIALRRSSLVRVDVKRVIGTSLHAGSATDAAIVIEVDDAVIAREQRGRWTDRRTWRILTMIAAMDAVGVDGAYRSSRNKWLILRSLCS